LIGEKELQQYLRNAKIHAPIIAVREVDKIYAIYSCGINCAESNG
jgi:hypothetical protein